MPLLVLLLIVIIICFYLRHALDGLPVRPKQISSGDDAHDSNGKQDQREQECESPLAFPWPKGVVCCRLYAVRLDLCSSAWASRRPTRTNHIGRSTSEGNRIANVKGMNAIN